MNLGSKLAERSETVLSAKGVINCGGMEDCNAFSLTLATGSALYYPYIHVRCLDHVKAALVYWDRVRRIVPDMMRGGPDRKYAFSS